MFVYADMTALQKYTACQQCTTFHRVQCMGVRYACTQVNMLHSNTQCMQSNAELIALISN